MLDLILSIPNGWWIFGLVVTTFGAASTQARISTENELNPLLKEGFWNGKTVSGYPTTIWGLLWFVCLIMTFATYAER